eukprot:TRINITY_DN25931_c0_g1_i1.p1 TRINITY_DN25931_c0_g1~~TRINITY_DN25931_c0_g1_i1.p1  ORF type:complete len:625 (+),score=59.90 TRINITY_DN25931_c0_g1_i1:70-1944(+)
MSAFDGSSVDPFIASVAGKILNGCSPSPISSPRALAVPGTVRSISPSRSTSGPLRGSGSVVVTLLRTSGEVGCVFDGCTLERVLPGTPADQQGLREYCGRDVTHVNSVPVASLQEIFAAARRDPTFLKLQFRPQPPTSVPPPVAPVPPRAPVVPSLPPRGPVSCAPPLRASVSPVGTGADVPVWHIDSPSAKPSRVSTAGEVVLRKARGEMLGLMLSDMLVKEEAPGSPASRSGVHAFNGCRLTHVDSTPVQSIEDVQKQSFDRSTVRLRFDSEQPKLPLTPAHPAPTAQSSLLSARLPSACAGTLAQPSYATGSGSLPQPSLDARPHVVPAGQPATPVDPRGRGSPRLWRRGSGGSTNSAGWDRGPDDPERKSSDAWEATLAQDLFLQQVRTATSLPEASVQHPEPSFIGSHQPEVRPVWPSTDSDSALITLRLAPGQSIGCQLDDMVLRAVASGSAAAASGVEAFVGRTLTHVGGAAVDDIDGVKAVVEARRQAAPSGECDVVLRFGPPEHLRYPSVLTHPSMPPAGATVVLAGLLSDTAANGMNGVVRGYFHHPSGEEFALVELPAPRGLSYIRCENIRAAIPTLSDAAHGCGSASVPHPVSLAASWESVLGFRPRRASQR